MSPHRIADLNDAAFAYFTSRYEHSWARTYLHERLPAAPAETPEDPQQTPGTNAGYAPSGWDKLVSHLRSTGATEEELLAAGLATQARTGRLIDRFRDRLIFPILGDVPAPDDSMMTGRIVGFVGRRHPDHDDQQGPKYLNTPATSIFTKGQSLFGLHEGAAALHAGATPVLVEGPLDARAVTLAGQGRYVGVASLGTAFTDAQAALLLAHQQPHTAERSTGHHHHGLLVATDADPAGQAAAERAYWMLAGLSRPDVGYVPLPPGQDPAQVLVERGPAALREILATATALSDHLVDTRIANGAHDHTVEGKVRTLRAAAEIIGSQRPATWLEATTTLTRRLNLLPTTIQGEIAQAVTAWSDNPQEASRRAASRPAPPPVREPARASIAPSSRWALLLAQTCPGLGLVWDKDWPALAAAFTRAEAAGYDIPANLERLSNDLRTAAPERPAQFLRHLLVQECPAASIPAPAPGSERSPSTPGSPTHRLVTPGQGSRSEQPYRR